MRDYIAEREWTYNSSSNRYSRNQISDLGTVCMDSPDINTVLPMSNTNHFLGTYGDVNSTSFFPAISSHGYIKDAMRVASKSTNLAVVKKAHSLLSDLSWALEIFRYNNADLSDLPALSPGSIEDDGAIVIEMITSKFRIGFGIEADEDESSWYIISQKDAGEIRASGKLDDSVEGKRLTTWLMIYALFGI